MNLPIPSPHGKACIVKIYEEDAAADGDGDDDNANNDGGVGRGNMRFSLNDLVEFVGIGNYSDQCCQLRHFYSQENNTNSAYLNVVWHAEVWQVLSLGG